MIYCKHTESLNIMGLITIPTTPKYFDPGFYSYREFHLVSC